MNQALAMGNRALYQVELLLSPLQVRNHKVVLPLNSLYGLGYVFHADELSGRFRRKHREQRVFKLFRMIRVLRQHHRLDGPFRNPRAHARQLFA